MEQGCDHFEQRKQAALGTSSRNAGDTITFPAALLVKQTYLILSEVSYLYTPTISYVMGKSGVTLSDVSYTRPRQVPFIVMSPPATVRRLAADCPLFRK